MKEQIIDIITDWIFDNKIDIKCTSEMAIDLATRLDKAIGIDEDTVWRKIVVDRAVILEIIRENVTILKRQREIIADSIISAMYGTVHNVETVKTINE